MEIIFIAVAFAFVIAIFIVVRTRIRTIMAARAASSESEHKTAAVEWLGYLRNGTEMYDSFIGYLHREVGKGKLSLADIGTSEEELAKLRVKGAKTAAEKWLGYLRKGTDMYESFIGYLHREVGRGKLSLADIGTSEEELAELRVK